jgi:hypothetical protein
MKTIEYTFIDKSSWPRGPWDKEPDKIQFMDAETGLPCLIVRADHHGALCGYVGISEGHPYFSSSYDNHYDLEAHGGLTFSDFCVESDKEHGICHIPGEGEPDRVYWLGFDCAHSGDFCPAYSDWSSFRGKEERYRTLDYVRAECARLARQLKAVESESALNRRGEK